ncbi:MAG TPA: alpha/beta fold hydrolase [Solirubrobacteraceae bacterium]
MSSAAGLSYREAGPADGPVALLVHGYPESSWMWASLLDALAGAGWRGVAPDLAGYGDSPADPPGTWQRHVESLERFVAELGLAEVALVVHDWGGLIGLRWACDHPGAARALVISDTGFFADGRWHGLADAMRTPGTGEEVVDGMTREGFGAALRSMSTGVDDRALDEYFKAFGDEARRRGQLELYRSGEFSELAGYEGRLAALGVPALVLWGAEDPFAPVAGAHRFARDLPGAEVVVLDGVGHFVFDDAPQAANDAVVNFLRRVDG